MKNIYSEMFESLSIPERLSPENIAAMLETNAAAVKNRAAISLSSASDRNERDGVSSTSSKKTGTRRVSSYYRTIVSLAACAAMVFGVVRYFDNSGIPSTDDAAAGSTYASDYDELHKTFRKYYVDDEEKKTLDSAMTQIEHSYNDSENDNVSDDVDSAEPSVSGNESGPEETTPNVPDSSVSPEEQGSQSVQPNGEGVMLPAPAGEKVPENTIISGNKIFVRDKNDVKVILTDNGNMEYVGNISPQCGMFETKTLEQIIPVGDRIALVYSVVNDEPVSIPVFDGGSTVDELMSSIYADSVETNTTHSAEVAVYDIYSDGKIVLASDFIQSGEFIGVTFNGGYVYVATDYDNYRHTPLIGVDDLDSYVPSYTVNGEKLYIQAENILIPGYVSTTDYTVVSGIAACEPSIPISVQAVLGSEGKVIITESAAYIFGYSNSSGFDQTVCEMLGFASGAVSYRGSVSVDGVALSNGIHEDSGVILVTTIKSSDTGYVTSVYALDSGMSVLSKIEFPAIMSDVSFDGSRVYLTSSAGSYAADFTSAAAPELISYEDNINIMSGAVEFGDGYVTLAKDDGGNLVLSKLITGDNGELSTQARVVVCPEGATSSGMTAQNVSSLALGDNSVMYVDPENGYVGVPYGFFDGYDYCYRYALYRLAGSSFELVGQIESHEVDDAFEIGRSILSDGILYITSEGRIYAAMVGESSLSVISSAEIIESSYSGHTSW